MRNFSHNIVALTLLSAASFAAQAQVLDNGGFEAWNANVPFGWSTIDTGIEVSQESANIYAGSYGAKVRVTTGSQSSTDLRQSVDVSAGQQYQFAVWVKHTEGNVRARLYVDGYQNYSNPAQINQWQQLSYTYTATSSGQIEVGLRFYDVSGFDGSEVVYIDEFTPSNGHSEPPTGSCSEHTVTLTLHTDNYGSETSWELSQQGGNVANGSGYQPNQEYNEDMCLADGDYTFTIFDSYGDGMCCGQGSGSYELSNGNTVLASGGQFTYSQATSFTLGDSDPVEPPPVDGYYSSASGLSGYALKTELHNLISNHANQGYGAIWGFYDQYARDSYYENDNSILDRYSERPSSTDSHSFISINDQCGSYSREGDCYNREHSFPKSWFGGKVEPMNSDVHHIFASDGYVNAKRGSYPFGEVGSASYTSSNGSKLGAARSGLGYSGTVFEPIDEFKGDFARAHFYMATRYQDRIAGWKNNSTYGSAVLDGSSNQVFSSWALTMLLQWHQQDPVSQAEIDRNNGAYNHQGNRNPYIDHPEFAALIWQ
ncbi:endonuclease I [Pseudoalteromonas ruthenica]|uniref:Endonuclease I n=1 Tax=Pseudoalteromonas ruthenica TaxID=151081 RepID=A0A5S3Z680_9GAMM|nr:endonuclease [Pseudoalteromonas ruthenica]TMP87390.1 endonuclease I [Pseudoalteromonas ruthenica]